VAAKPILRCRMEEDSGLSADDGEHVIGISSAGAKRLALAAARGEARQARGRWPDLGSPLGVGVLCFAVAALANAVLLHESGRLSGDSPYYERIASHPAGPHNFPYAFRIGLPYLVHVLPFSHTFSWELLALLAAGGAGGALYALLLEFDIDRPLAGWLAVGFSVSPSLLVVFLRDGRGVDAAAVLVITLGCLFIVRRQKVPLVVTLLVGTTIHESCMFLVPLMYAVWAERPIDPKALRDVAAVAAVPVAVYLYLRASIVAVGEAYQPGYTGPFFQARIDVLRDALQNGGWHVELRRVALVYGPLWLAAPFAVRALRFARRGLMLVGFCLVSMTFALDWGRAIFFAAPVIYVAAAYAVRNRRRLAVAMVIGLLALDCGYAVYMQVHGVKHGLDTTAPSARGPVY
jgi:hypothetical protein